MEKSLQNITFDDANKFVIDSLKEINYVSELNSHLVMPILGDEVYLKALQKAAGFHELFLHRDSDDQILTLSYLALAQANLSFAEINSELKDNYVFKTIYGFNQTLSRNFDKAEKTLLEAKNLNDNPIVNLYLGHTFLKTNNLVESKEAYNHAVELYKSELGISEHKAVLESELMLFNKFSILSNLSTDSLDNNMRQKLEQRFGYEGGCTAFMQLRLSVSLHAYLLSDGKKYKK